MKRIASLSILFTALIEFAIERARFDLWIVGVVVIVTLPRPKSIGSLIPPIC